MPINKIITLECHFNINKGGIINYNVDTGKCNYGEFRTDDHSLKAKATFFFRGARGGCGSFYTMAAYWIGFRHRGLLPEFVRCLEAKEFDRALKIAGDCDYGNSSGLYYMKIILNGILKDPTSPYVKLTVKHVEVGDRHPLSNYPMTVVGGIAPEVADAVPQANAAASPANAAASPANVAASPANVAASPANVAASPANVAASPANDLAPGANATVPQVNSIEPIEPAAPRLG